MARVLDSNGHQVFPKVIKENEVTMYEVTRKEVVEKQRLKTIESIQVLLEQAALLLQSVIDHNDRNAITWLAEAEKEIDNATNIIRCI